LCGCFAFCFLQLLLQLLSLALQFLLLALELVDCLLLIFLILGQFAEFGFGLIEFLLQLFSMLLDVSFLD
jgi:hypothetical protein